MSVIEEWKSVPFEPAGSVRIWSVGSHSWVVRFARPRHGYWRRLRVTAEGITVRAGRWSFVASWPRFLRRTP